MPPSASGGSTDALQAQDGLSFEGDKVNGRFRSEAVISLRSAVFTLKVIIVASAQKTNALSTSVGFQAGTVANQFVY